jgi:hypothetical protein
MGMDPIDEDDSDLKPLAVQEIQSYEQTHHTMEPKVWAFHFGKRRGRRDCRNAIFKYQQEFGFEAAKKECGRSVEELHYMGMDGEMSMNVMIDVHRQTFSILNKTDSKVDLPTDTDEPVSEPKP